MKFISAFWIGLITAACFGFAGWQYVLATQSLTESGNGPTVLYFIGVVISLLLGMFMVGSLMTMSDKKNE